MQPRYFILVVLSIISLNCRKSDSIVSPAESPNLLANGSFESNGNQSFDGWSINVRANYIPRYLKFSQDVPPGGGSWAAVIDNPDSFIVVLKSSIDVSKGSHTYRLSFWAKSNSPTAEGSLEYQWTKDIAYGSGAKISDSTWRQYTVTYRTFDTLSTSDSTKAIADSSRSVFVSLLSIFSKTQSKTYFDLLKLEKID